MYSNKGSQTLTTQKVKISEGWTISFPVTGNSLNRSLVPSQVSNGSKFDTEQMEIKYDPSSCERIRRLPKNRSRLSSFFRPWRQSLHVVDKFVSLQRVITFVLQQRRSSFVSHFFPDRTWTMKLYFAREKELRDQAADWKSVTGSPFEIR